MTEEELEMQAERREKEETRGGAARCRSIKEPMRFRTAF